MSDDVMRLSAEIVDKFSKPVQDMRRSLQELAKYTKTASKQGVEDTKTHTKAFTELQKTVALASQKVKGQFVPAIDAMGLSAITATTSLAGIVAVVKSVAGSVQNWQYLSKETGLTVAQLRGYEAMAKRVGASSEAMDSSLQGFAHTLTDLWRGMGGAFSQLNVHTALRPLADQLRASRSAAEALKDVFATLDKIQGRNTADTIQQRENVLKMLGLLPQLARLTGEQRKSLEAWTAQHLSLSAAEVKGSLDAAKGFWQLGEEIDQIKTKIGAGLAPQITALVTDLGDLSKGLSTGNWQGFGRDLANINTQLGELQKHFQDKIDWAAFFNLAQLSDLGDELNYFVTFWKMRFSEVKDLIMNGGKDSPRTQKLLNELMMTGKRLGDATPFGVPGAQWPVPTRSPTGGATLTLPPGTQHPPATLTPEELRKAAPHIHLESYHPTGAGTPRLIDAAYRPGGGSTGSALRDLQDAVATGTEKGIVAGLRDWIILAAAWRGQGGGSGGGGIVRAAYHPHAGGAPLTPAGAPGGAPSAGGVGTYGLPAPAAHVSRSLAKNQQEAYDAARSSGLSDSAARILVANMSGESLRNPANRHWDVSHISQGIVQWDPARAARIRQHFGLAPAQMSVAEQTRAAIWEMKTNPAYHGAWSALNNEHLSAARRMYGVVRGYERPADPWGDTETRLRLLHGLHVHERAAHNHDLLRRAHHSGMLSGNQKVTGDASLKIDLNGFPKGARTAMSASGLFKKISLVRGAVPIAAEES